MITVFVLLFGLIVGSFLNVCIIRLPTGGSIAHPPSHCPRCGQGISFYDNIPVLSFLLLRGKCRRCGEAISLRYPVVELINGLVYLLVLHEFGISGEALLVMLLCSSLIVITFIDYDHQIIPDVITLPGMIAGLLFAPLFMSELASPLPFGLGHLLPQTGPYLTGFLNSLIGLILGGGPLLAIGWTWEKLRKVEAMGGGDIKLMGMVGSFLGWKCALLTIMLGAVAGSVAGISLIVFKQHNMEKVIPFGPFLAVGAFASAFYGGEIITWYLGLLHP